MEEVTKKIILSKINNCKKIKKNGDIDMRYKENIKIFSKKYKELLIIENRKHNSLTKVKKNNNYRHEIINLSEKEIMIFKK